MEARSSISGKTNPFLIFLDLSRKLISKSSSLSGPLTSFPINFLHFPAAVCTLAITKSPHLSMTNSLVCEARLESPSDRLAFLSESAITLLDLLSYLLIPEEKVCFHRCACDDGRRNSLATPNFLWPCFRQWGD